MLIKEREPLGFGEAYKLDQFIHRIQEYVRVALLLCIESAVKSPRAKAPINWKAYGY